MNASERFLAVLDAAKAYLVLYGTKLTSDNLGDETTARHDARARLAKAVEDWDA